MVALTSSEQFQNNVIRRHMCHKNKVNGRLYINGITFLLRLFFSVAVLLF